MSVPPNLLMQGGGAPGNPGGGPPGPGGPGGGEEVLQLLASMQQQSSPSAEESMLFHATLMINGAYAKVANRNGKVGEHLSKANIEVSKALQLLKSANNAPMNKPPDLGGGGAWPMMGSNPGAM